MRVRVIKLAFIRASSRIHTPNDRTVILSTDAWKCRRATHLPNSSPNGRIKLESWNLKWLLLILHLKMCIQFFRRLVRNLPRNSCDTKKCCSSWLHAAHTWICRSTRFCCSRLHKWPYINTSIMPGSWTLHDDERQKIETETRSRFTSSAKCKPTHSFIYTNWQWQWRRELSQTLHFFWADVCVCFSLCKNDVIPTKFFSSSLTSFCVSYLFAHGSACAILCDGRRCHML